MEIKQKILIVDDRPENIFSLKRVLAGIDTEIIEALTGNDALIASLHHEFALAILDVQMPEMDGYELAELLRSEEKTSSIPIIFMSAVYSSDYHVFKGYEAGAVDFLVKPFETRILLSKVNIFLELDRQKSELAASKETLEKKVAERTHELMAKNRELQAEIERRKKAEQSVRKAQKQWEEIFEAIGHMAVVIDDNHTIIAANRSAVKQIGMPKKALIGAKCHDIFHGSKNPIPDCPIKKHKKGRLSPSEMIIEIFDKTYIRSTTPVFEGNDNYTKFIAIFTDITRRKVLEKELLQAHKMEAIGTLAGGIAHDFNNILSALIGFSQLALKNAEKDSLMEDDLTEILNCGLRAKELVRQILTFARQSDEKYSYIHLDYIVKEVAKFIRSTIPSSIDLKTEVQSASLVFANPTQIHQVLMNLCTNSAHAMKNDGGILKISLTDERIDKKDTNSTQNPEPGNYVKLEVSDTGTGIALHVMEKMFEPYFTTKAQGEGTGMGLAMVQGIVKDIGGTIKVKTALGQGTIFTIFIPIADSEEIDPYTEEAIYPSEGSEMILLVDDEPAITKVGKRMLEKAGYDVIIANTPCDALDLFKEKPAIFDLVMTDLTMPGMNGDKLTEKILEIRPDIPVVLCSGYQNKHVMDAEMKHLWHAFVQKPIKQEIFINTIRKVLDENTKG
ncbi:ATP-binding response regulator [Desulfobacter curvatus]|uniref:ATP-binding response regulator n=1 Tax=Desulfobacter curvatus TaxID=2290 RepID=UPI00036A1981|nr:response regulator [Desulfobacter curvatus]